MIDKKAFRLAAAGKSYEEAINLLIDEINTVTVWHFARPAD